MSHLSRFLLLFLLTAMSLGAASAQPSSRPRATTVFRSLHLLGQNVTLTRTSARPPVASTKPTVASSARTARSKTSGKTGKTVQGTVNLTASDLQFSFQGYTSAQRTVLQNFVNNNYARMTAIYGQPAPEQTGKTVTVQNDAQITAAYAPPLPGGATGGTIFFRYNDAASGAVNTYNFTRLALISFQGPRVPAFDFRAGNYVEPWLYGAADAAAILVAYAAAGSPAGFDPSQLGGYVLPVYDYLNSPQLGNAYIYPRDGTDLVVSDFRLAMAQAAFLKIAVENPNFFSQFNAALYARGAAGASIDSAQLQTLAASVVPTVEGQNFDDWARRQYALESSVTVGQKLYLAIVPLPAAASGDTRSGFSGFAQAFKTQSDGGESASSGYGNIKAFDEAGNDISSFSAELRSSNILAFTATNAPGQASFGAGFSSFGAAQALVTLKARFAEAEATGYFPYGAPGNTASASSYFGGTLGGRNGALQIGGSAAETVTVSRGAWAATSPYPSGPRVQTLFSFGGANLQRNTAWLTPGDAARSVAFLLQVPANLTTFTLTIPSGSSRYRMISLPFVPLATDEAGVLGAGADLPLARYRPDLSEPTAQGDALVFGVGGDNYEIYPNISMPFAPGRGYWLAVDGDTAPVVIAGSALPAQTTEVPLEGGWNQIGVPFNRSFSVDAIRVRYGGFAPVSLSVAQSRGWVAPGIWRWLPEGGYVRVDVGGGQLEPFEGYFIFAGAQTGVSLVFDPAAQSVASLVRAAPGSWSLSLVAAGATSRDIAARFGVSNLPSIAGPPAGAQVVTLRFEGGDANGAGASGSGLAEAYVDRINAGTTTTWTATVEGASPGEKVTLSWDKTAIPAGVRLTLVNGQTGARTAMNQSDSVEFTANGTTSSFTIEAETDAVPSANQAPTVAPVIAPAAPQTGDTLSVAANASDADGDALTLSYQWKKGEQLLAGETDATLDLSQPSNGDAGDVISVEVTADDGRGGVTSATASVEIAGESVPPTEVPVPPVAKDGRLRTGAGVRGSVVLSGLAADGGALTFERVGGPVHGKAQVKYDQSAGVWKLYYTGNTGFTGDDKVRFVAIDANGTRSKVATISVTVVPGYAWKRSSGAGSAGSS